MKNIPIPSENRTQNIMLDVFRAFAVLLVLKSHWLYFDLNLFGSFKEPYEIYNNFENYILHVYRFIHPGVLMFIVLSGFIIHYTNTASNKSADLRWSLRFILRRFARLYPIFIIALISGYLVQYYLYKELDGFDWDILWQNSIFLYGLQYVHPPAINNILVTVESEFWLYVVYAIIFKYLTNKKRWYALIFVCFLIWFFNVDSNISTTSSVGNVIYWNKHNLIAFLLYWFMGAFAAEIAKTQDTNKISWLAPLCAFLLVLAILPFEKALFSWHMFNELFMALTWSLLLIKLSKIQFDNFLTRLFAKIGQAGYSIYAFHMCLFMLFTSKYMQENYGGYANPYLVFVYTIIICLSIYYLFEKPLHLKTKQLFRPV